MSDPTPITRRSGHSYLCKGFLITNCSCRAMVHYMLALEYLRVHGNRSDIRIVILKFGMSVFYGGDSHTLFLNHVPGHDGCACLPDYLIDMMT